MLPEQPSTAAAPALPTLAEFIHTPIVNYALQQAHVPLVHRVALKNETTRDWTDLRIHIALSSDFAARFEHRVDLLPVGGIVELDAVQLPVRSIYLAELTERMDDELRLTVLAGEETLFSEVRTVAILPYDHWHGAGLLPETLAAFITPNHPQIPALIRRASEVLAGWTGNPSFDEYQSRNPDRVRKQMAAIYEAIAELQVVYCSVPASFEETGQRVRLADAVLAQKMGNCLDMALLYAACLEAVGIHPFIVIIRGHAFAGAWLVEESFADPVNDDPSLLTKRTAPGINEVALVECTCMNAGKTAHFEDAARAAESHLLDTSAFVLFVDVKRARFSRIRPLPLRVPAAGGGFELVAEEPKMTRVSDAPTALGETLIVVDGKPVAVGKQQLWERKLLDLTLRNNLLNLRVTKGTVQFIHINPAKLEDALAGGGEFGILAKPADWENPLRSAGLYQTLHDADPMLELAAHELAQHRLRCYLGETELTANLTALYRSSRTAIEENGASTLYIALGFLKWYETPASEVPRYAPILLLPVEIVRKSARQGFVVRSREEEPMMNITLLEKLRQDYGITIGGLDPLPRDESGVDVPAVFNILRRGIMAQARWDVEEQVVLGTFSFAKFILWNDIHNNAPTLLQNKTVASLVSGKLEWTTVPEAPRSLDEQFSPDAIALPIATDSSQLEAVIASGEGGSFVLHGPPGTGKSQTITNIIANALFSGKKVLFVAAKKAALDVVESRLESIGIGPFCLELHSNKGKKTAVIEQLKRAASAARTTAPEAFAREAARLGSLRTELNEHVRALHRRWPFGLSLYEAFSRWSAEEERVPDAISIPHHTLATLTADGFQDWVEAVAELSITGRAIGTPATHPLRGTAPLQYTPQARTEAASVLREWTDALKTLEAFVAEAARILHIPNASTNAQRTETVAALATAVLAMPDAPAALLSADSPKHTAEKLKAWTAHGRAMDAQRSALLQSFTAGVLTVDAAHLLAQWNTASGKWFLPKWLGERKVAKALKPFAADGTLDKSAIPETLHSVISYKAEAARVTGDAEAQRLAGFLWRNEETDWDAIDAAADAVVDVSSRASALIGAAEIKNWRAAFATSAVDGTVAFTEACRPTLEHFIAAHSAVKQIRSRVDALLHTSSAESDAENNRSWMQADAEKAARWSGGLDGLKDWCAWNMAAQKASPLGLDAVATALARGDVDTSGLEASFRKSFYRAAAEYILGQSPGLASFNAALFEEKIARFKSISESFEALTRQELSARLAARIPDFSQEASQSSEVGILQKAIRSNGRAMSIRKLFDAISTLLPRLMPCALMSPISVAQYFDAGGPKFDLVIFDEASQLPTCEAVGAIARGTSVIVVGDPKQMPPTSFFATAAVDEDNLEKEDLESILDDCLALSMPSRHLLWHYRSKHESLIAFSNAKYYDNALLTFPSTDDLATRVRAVHVPGFYDKGKTRQNRAEARAIVAEIVRRLGDLALSRRSIGVVTFSVVQQNLIEDLLTEEFRTAPQLEKAALERDEPLFIKNLENVQGDERDVILFSICYGPDESGRVSLNFGPLNREGGWRRLNVAVSRARYEMMVFATLKSDDIDLARTSAEGVAGLKAFLVFAEKGKSALPAKAVMAGAVTGAGLESSIADAIRKMGHTVHQGVGCSAYRMDLAVVHPARPHQYLLGILCDGPAYGAARTARDRELVQTGVLCALGWRLHRVWATDWWEKKDAVLSGIQAAMEAALAAADGVEEQLQELQASETDPPDSGVHAEALLKSSAASSAVDFPIKTVATPVYAVHALMPVKGASPELFMEPRSRRKVMEQISEVLEKESPVSKTLLYRRVLDAWGISRAGSRLAAHLDSLMHEMNILQSVHGKRTFLWWGSQHPEHYAEYRLPANDAEKREAEDLPPQEVAAAVHALLQRQLSLPRSEAVREVARMLGYGRLGSKVEEVMREGVEEAARRGWAVMQGERVATAG